MPAPQRHCTTRALACVRGRESGFGVVEIMVAMLIVAILMGVAIVSFSGAKGAGNAKEAVAAAAAYDGAIAKHMSDNGNQRPTPAQMMLLQGKPAGPRSLANPAKPYLPQLPDGVVGGRIGVSMDGTTNCATTLAAPSGAAAAGATSWISYCTAIEPQPGYGIRLITRKKPGSSWTSDGAKLCWRGSTRLGPRCG